MQEIYRLLDIISHTASMTTTGSLYKITLEVLMLEIGSTWDLHWLLHLDYHCLASNSLIKSTWQFLSSNSIQLLHSITFSVPREHDMELMTFFIDQHIPFEDLYNINLCRLYLKAFFLSDIVDRSRTTILNEAWQGNLLNEHNSETWPKQGKPAPAMWDTWWSYLKRNLIGQGRCLQNPLGQWLFFEDDWPWFLSTQENKLVF